MGQRVMIKSIVLIWILACSIMLCQAQNPNVPVNCEIRYSVNKIENSSIEVPNACIALNEIIANKIEDDISLIGKYYASNIGIQSFLGEPNRPVGRLTYEVTLRNEGNPALDDIVLEAKLCDGLVYESSEYKEGSAIFYEPTVIQRDETHTTSEIRWWIGTLFPGEERTLSLKTLYLSTEAPEKGKTEFKMNARLWGYNIYRKNDQLVDIS